MTRSSDVRFRGLLERCKEHAVCVMNASRSPVLQAQCSVNELARNCCQLPVQGQVEQDMYAYAYPALLVLSVVGNLANIVVYRHPFLRDSTTVRMLFARAVANLLFSCSLAPNFIYAVHHARDASAVTDGYLVASDDTIEAFYWNSLQYVGFLSNVLNTVSVW